MEFGAPSTFKLKIFFSLSEARDRIEVALVKPDLLVVGHRLLDEVLHVRVVGVG